MCVFVCVCSLSQTVFQTVGIRRPQYRQLSAVYWAIYPVTTDFLDTVRHLPLTREIFVELRCVLGVARRPVQLDKTTNTTNSQAVSAALVCDLLHHN